MEILYCKKWWFHKKKPIDILNEEIARSNHLKGEDYTAVLSHDGVISYIIEISKADVFVNFMDDNERKYLTYVFHKEMEDNVFLSTAYYHYYEKEKEKELLIFSFKENGELYMEKRNLLNGEVDEKEAVVDVSCNWEKFSEFGDYSNLIVLERELNTY